MIEILKMNILIDIGHPGHVHLFKNIAKKLAANGHSVIFAARKKSMIISLLDSLGFPYFIASKPRTGLIGLFYEMLEHDWHVLKLTLKYKIDLLMGTSVAAAHISKITRAKSMVFNEDDSDYVKLFAAAAYPFADYIVTPKVLRDTPSKSYRQHNSYHELAYLHPENFVPNPSILETLGVEEGEKFYILRLVAFKAHHDVGHGGITPQMQTDLINYLTTTGKVFITMEGEIPEEFAKYQLPLPPDQIHHALYYAAMLISDSQTMTMEAAVLGTPAIRYNTFVGRCSVITELEDKYNLALGYKPGEEVLFMKKISELNESEDTKKLWNNYKENMLADKEALDHWVINLINKEIFTKDN